MSIAVTLLGTGGPRPNPTRNQSCLVVTVDDESYLVDCGDGAAAQLAKAGIDPAGLTTLLLTHLHVDHCFGVAPFVYAGWFNGRSALRMLGPSGTEDLINTLLNGAYLGDVRLRLDSGRPAAGLVPDSIQVGRIAGDPVLETDSCRITAFQVPHNAPTETYALRFEDGAGRSLVLSSDTGYSEPFAEFARDADLLVHECYLTGGSQFSRDSAGFKEFITSVHVTPEQAGQIGRLAGAKRLVLTHFPERFDESTVEAQAGEAYGGPVTLGQDFMQLVV